MTAPIGTMDDTQQQDGTAALPPSSALIVNDPDGLCLGSTHPSVETSAAGVYTSLLTLAAKMKSTDGEQQQPPKSILIETSSKNIFIKQVEGHAVAFHVTKEDSTESGDGSGMNAATAGAGGTGGVGTELLPS